LRSLRRSSGQRNRFDPGKPVGKHFTRVHKIVVSLDGLPDVPVEGGVGVLALRRIDRSLRVELPSQNAPWQHGNCHVFGHTVDAPQFVNYLQFYPMLGKAIRVALGQTRGLLSL
jgi:hypothetical protein